MRAVDAEIRLDCTEEEALSYLGKRCHPDFPNLICDRVTSSQEPPMVFPKPPPRRDETLRKMVQDPARSQFRGRCIIRCTSPICPVPR